MPFRNSNRFLACQFFLKLKGILFKPVLLLTCALLIGLYLLACDLVLLAAIVLWCCVFIGLLSVAEIPDLAMYYIVVLVCKLADILLTFKIPGNLFGAVLLYCIEFY